MSSKIEEERPSLQEVNLPCNIALYGQDAQRISSLKKSFAEAETNIELIIGAPRLEVTLAETLEELKSLAITNLHAIIFDICTDAEQGLFFRGLMRVENPILPILFLVPESHLFDSALYEQFADDPYTFVIPGNIEFKALLTKLKHCVNFELLKMFKDQFDRNKKLASHLQQTMLPPWVHFGKSYEFSTFYLPFNEVGGDLFEWFPLDDDRVLFIFGDVSGHETYSALAMSAVQSFLRQLIEQDKEKARRPCLIAKDINDFFCHHLMSIVNMGALIAYFDFKENYLCYLNAGYMDLLCFDAITGEINVMNKHSAGGSTLGWKEDSNYTEDDSVEYYFSDFSVFMFFSDGLLDLAKDFSGNTFMDIELFKKLVSELVLETQTEEKSIAIPFRCYHLLGEHGYVFPQDDLTMGIIRKPQYQEKEYTFACRVPADNKAVDEICEKVSAFVMKYYQDERLSVDTELLLEEYLVNVVMHGLDEYEKLYEYIAIKLCAYEDKLKLMIWDHGKEWDGVLMQKEKAEDTLDWLNEGLLDSGRGLPIISKIASEGGRQRFSGLNENIFIIPKRTETEGAGQ